MAYTKDDLDALDEAIAAGELSVEIDGRKVTYRSMEDLFRARRHICRMMAKAAGVRRSPLAGIATRVDRGIR